MSPYRTAPTRGPDLLGAPPCPWWHVLRRWRYKLHVCNAQRHEFRRYWERERHWQFNGWAGTPPPELNGRDTVPPYRPPRYVLF